MQKKKKVLRCGYNLFMQLSDWLILSGKYWPDKISIAHDLIFCVSVFNMVPPTQASNFVHELIKTLGHNGRFHFFRHISDLVLVSKEPCSHTDTHNMTVSWWSGYHWRRWRETEETNRKTCWRMIEACKDRGKEREDDVITEEKDRCCKIAPIIIAWWGSVTSQNTHTKKIDRHDARTQNA